MRIRSTLFALLCCALTHAAPSLAQEPLAPQELLDARSKPLEELASRGYLASVLNLMDLEPRALESDMLRTFYQDILAGQLAYVGEQLRATALGDEAYPRTQEPVDPDHANTFIETHRPLPALQAIIEAARDRQIVMINEEHRSSMQRAFANQLLEPLRELGFTHLAMETLEESADALHARGYPVLSTGTYTDDPALGDLVRRAIELGYTLVPYEADAEDMDPRPDDTSPADAMNRRERGQAEHIFERTLQLDPNARVLVYAGRDHLSEYAGEVWVPMGAVLKEISGIDPLTINQYVMVEHSKPIFESWQLAFVENAGWLDATPILLRKEQGELWSLNPHAIDAYVFHPRTTLIHSRPSWLAMGGLRKAHIVDIPPHDEPVLLQAMVPGESDDAIPMDQAIVWPGGPTPGLFLRLGKYTVRVINRDGDILSSETVTIK
ncbi:MAG: hypothetical protein ACF8GE_01595 [Phycisphaerales bacterium JB043]